MEKDFYDLQKRAVIINAFDNYVQAGGFPEYLKTANYQILQEYFKDIIQKDIIYRNSIRYKKELKEIAKIIISGPGNVLSLSNIAATVGLKNIGTVKNYIEFLQESYFVLGIPLFSPSLKKQIYNPSKYYGIDPGLYRAVSFGLTENIGPLLENIVFLELKRRLKGVAELFYYKTRTGKEIDFLVTDNGKIRLYQVCYDLSNETTKQREIRAAVEAAKEIGIPEVTILNGNLKESIQQDGITISILPTWEFLLETRVDAASTFPIC
jgi:predicted AAA+ superfamily ATPase